MEQTELAAIRRYKNISQKDMALLLDVDLRTYINKEKGITQFKLNEMFIISKEFGRKIEEIFLPYDSTLRAIDAKEEINCYSNSK